MLVIMKTIDQLMVTNVNIISDIRNPHYVPHGLPAAVTVVPVSCDFCPAKCERNNNIPHNITESRRLYVRRTYRAEAEETARHRRATRAA